ncbi:MAG TPA: ABC transporter ATP-binding protein [Xanthobacteraceae bacterium]|nr:ABC transporter ATP-binding protein [Xanthobacteraceae bacterium]
MPVLAVENLSVTYRTARGPVHAVDRVSFSLEGGDSLGLVGESGCGKTTIGKALLRILPEGAIGPKSRIVFEGQDLLSLGANEMRAIRGRRIGLIPQSAMNALDPVVRVSALIREAMAVHGLAGGRAAEERIKSLFAAVGLDPDRRAHYPHMFSGGMRQRATIALAFALEPTFLIADEPTTGLDVIVQDQVLKELAKLVRQRGTTFIIITHDIGVVAEHCRRVAVMYAGRVMEIGPTADVLVEPTHPYTMGLQNGFLGLRGAYREIVSIPGAPPSLSEIHPGCPFCDRCPFAEAVCRSEVPPLAEVAPGHFSACHFRDRAAALRAQSAEPETWGRRLA